MENIAKAIEDLGIEDFEQESHNIRDWWGHCEWCTSHFDMLELSKQFPDALFELKGQGDDFGDIWGTYYKNGKYHDFIRIVYSDFDKNLLTDVELD